LGLRGTKDTVVALAAKVQDLHEHIINELAVSRNLKRFPMEGDGASGRRPGNVPGESNIGGHYDQTYHKLNVLFNTPQSNFLFFFIYYLHKYLKINIEVNLLYRICRWWWGYILQTCLILVYTYTTGRYVIVII
jgi:hypothetical protein